VSQLERDEDFGVTSAAALVFMAREYAAENLAGMMQDASSPKTFGTLQNPWGAGG
jgi:hypothetical protein